MSISSVGLSASQSYLLKDTTLPSSVKTQEDGKTPLEKSVKETFLEYAEMNPIERLRTSYLKDHNLTEEELAALPKEKRERIEKDIQEYIKKQLGMKEEGGQNAAQKYLDISV